MNYELIYKVRKSGHPTDSHSNLRVQFENVARDKADAAHKGYLDFLTAELGHSDFEVTNVYCNADGVLGHVYAGSDIKGVGKRKCVFCGCDDFND